MEVEITMTRRTISVLAAPGADAGRVRRRWGRRRRRRGPRISDDGHRRVRRRARRPAARPGRYRLTITEDCDDYTVTITQEGGDFTYEISNSPIRIVFVNDVPGGNFLIEQTNPDCTDWTLDLARVSGG